MPVSQKDGIVSPTITFISPDGERVEVWSLGQLASEYGLDRRALWAVAKGKRQSHRGWMLVGTQRRRRLKYRLVNIKTGELAEFSSIAEWAEAQGLKAGRIRKLLNNQIRTVAGWRQEGNQMSERQVRVPFTIYHSNGAQVVVENVIEFCERYGLHRQNIYRLFSGELQTYSGWSLNHTITQTQVEMEGPNGQIDYVRGNAKAFADEHGLDTSALYRVLKGAAKSVRGWRVRSR